MMKTGVDQSELVNVGEQIDCMLISLVASIKTTTFWECILTYCCGSYYFLRIVLTDNFNVAISVSPSSLDNLSGEKKQ